MTASHKKSLAEGRTMSATVACCLAAINTPKKRGRKVSKATLTERLDQVQASIKTATGVDRCWRHRRSVIFKPSSLRRPLVAVWGRDCEGCGVVAVEAKPRAHAPRFVEDHAANVDPSRSSSK